MANSEDNSRNKEKKDKKTVYKETKDPINEKEPDSGDTSSVADLDRTDFTSKPARSNKPMGSGHEPGTV